MCEVGPPPRGRFFFTFLLIRTGVLNGHCRLKNRSDSYHTQLQPRSNPHCTQFPLNGKELCEYLLNILQRQNRQDKGQDARCMSIDINPGFRQLGCCAPVAVNSGLRPETRSEASRCAKWQKFPCDIEGDQGHISLRNGLFGTGFQRALPVHTVNRTIIRL